MQHNLQFKSENDHHAAGSLGSALYWTSLDPTWSWSDFCKTLPNIRGTIWSVNQQKSVRPEEIKKKYCFVTWFSDLVSINNSFFSASQGLFISFQMQISSSNNNKKYSPEIFHCLLVQYRYQCERFVQNLKKYNIICPWWRHNRAAVIPFMEVTDFLSQNLELSKKSEASFFC